MRFAFQLLRKDNILTFKVLEQEDKVKMDMKLHGDSYIAENHWHVRVANVPEINPSAKTIFLRGSQRSEDNRLQTLKFRTNDECDEMYETVVDALNEVFGKHIDYDPPKGFFIYEEE